MYVYIYIYRTYDIIVLVQSLKQIGKRNQKDSDPLSEREKTEKKKRFIISLKAKKGYYVYYICNVEKVQRVRSTLLVV